MMEDSVQLNIKRSSTSATNAFGDVSLQRPLHSTISSLKLEIQKAYPDAPAPSSQKLIFAGRVLTDEQNLSDILRLLDKTHPVTFHLLISSIPSVPTPQPQAQPTTIPGVQRGFPMAPGGGYYGGYYPQPGFQAGYGYGYNYGYPGAAYAYARAQPPFPQTPLPPQAQAQAQQIPPPLARPPIHQRLLQRFENQDLIFLLKLALLVFFFSQGGSTSRTILLCVIALFIFLYQTGRLRVMARIEINNNRHVMGNAAPPPPQQQQPGQQPNDQQAAGAAAPQPEVPPARMVEDEDGVPVWRWQPRPYDPNRNFILREIEDFVVPFFLSLHPYWQPVPPPARPPPVVPTNDNPQQPQPPQVQ